MGIPGHVTCLLRNLYVGQEATVRTRHEKTDWFKIGKGVHQNWESSKLGRLGKAVYCHPDYLTYMPNTSCKMSGWMKHKLESRLPGKISITSDRELTPPLWQKVKKNWRASWWMWKRRVKKLALNSTFRKLRSWHHFLAYRWGNKGNSNRLDFLGLQNHCRWWLQPWNSKTIAP